MITNYPKMILDETQDLRRHTTDGGKGALRYALYVAER